MYFFKVYARTCWSTRMMKHNKEHFIHVKSKNDER